MFGIITVLLLSVYDAAQDSTNLPSIPDGITIHKIVGDWKEADLLCKKEGAVLASPITPRLLNIMKSLIGINNTPYLIGATFNEKTRSFTSVEGVPLENMTAAVMSMVQQLDPQDGSCLSMDRYNIRVVPCSSRLPFMCYKHQLEYDTFTTETTETNVEKTEYQKLCDEGYIFNPTTRMCYKFHTELKTWKDALITCRSEGGHLVIVNDDVQAELIKNMVLLQKFPHMYVGIHKTSEDGIWRTAFGTIFDYNAWVNNDSPSGDGSFCGIILPTGKLDKYDCTLESNFICEQLAIAD